MVSFALMWVQSKIIVITLSEVSIDCSVFILLNMFGLAVQSGVSGPQGADSAPSVLWVCIIVDNLPHSETLCDFVT